jgi:arsenate reductase-like glutaredoxin family protein
MRVIGLSTCDTCRKALRAMRDAGHAPEVIDIRADGIASADLRAIVAAHGDAAVNRASATWRGLPEAARAGDPAALIAAHPTLLKRLAILHEGRWTLGWGPAVQKSLL